MVINGYSLIVLDHTMRSVGLSGLRSGVTDFPVPLTVISVL